jgi:predicted dehydrogenase
VPYRAAVIGCGRKGLTIDDELKCPTNYCHGPAAHATALAAMSELELIAVADINPLRLALASQRHPGVRTYTSYDAMLAESDLDLVVVATQTPDRAAATVTAAKAGVRVVIAEKAMATSMAEAHAMLDACAAAGTKLLINHPRRYHPTFSAVEQAVAAGRIGKLQSIVGTVGNGVVHNGSHFFDLFRLYAGHARAVRGSLTGPADADGPGFAFVEFDDGVIGTLDAQSSIEVALTLNGTGGKIVVDSVFPGYELTEYVRRDGAGPKEWFQGSRCKSKRTETVYVPADDEGTTLLLYRDALNTLERGIQPRSSGEDGAGALEIALAAFASHRLGGATITLPLDDVDLTIPSR